MNEDELNPPSEMDEAMRQMFQKQLSGFYRAPTKANIVAMVQEVLSEGKVGLREIVCEVPLPWHKRLWLKLRRKDMPTYLECEMVVVLPPSIFGKASVRDAVVARVIDVKPAGVFIDVNFYEGAP